MPPWKIYRLVSPACDVADIHARFAGDESVVGAMLGGYFSDSHYENLHKKKLITKELQGRLKNLHLKQT
jgi:hypothetical protein